MTAGGASASPGAALGTGPLAGHADRIWPATAALVGLTGEGVAVAAATTESARWNELAVAAAILAYTAVGVLILWHRPGHPIGRLAVVLGAIWGPGEALVATSYAALLHDPHDTMAALGSTAGSFLRGLPWLVSVLVLPLVFPDGHRLDTRLARMAGRVSAAALACFVLATVLSPSLSDLRVEDVANPLGLPARARDAVDAVAASTLLLGVVAIGLAVAVLVQRYRCTGALGRQQTLLFALAFLPPVAALGASVSDVAGPWLFGVASVPLPLLIGVAVLQRRLYDVPLALNRSLTYGTLWLSIALLYAITVGGVGAMLQQRGAVWLPWAAAGIVAVSFAPLREGLQRTANRVTYGQWAQPDEVRSRTARRVGDATNLPGLLQSLVAELADDLGLGHLEVTGPYGEVLAAAGPEDGAYDELPLTAYGAPVGALRWSRRALRVGDLELLGDLARQLGAVVHAHGLLESIRAAQERLVLAREEERRRLRRDLHDGLGPALAGLTLQVDTVRNRTTDPNADTALLDLRSGIQATVADVRRMVEGLRPASLDDLGLVEAVRQLAGGVDLQVTVEASDLPPLPAAVEVAAYRILQEALTNAARHSGGTMATVRLLPGRDLLRIEVADDGSGAVLPRPDGVGLDSMRTRAEEIGGSFELQARPGTGTTIVTTLPLVEGATR
ncbi:MAG TPA: sensor histidine kinase [Marmoricola sp.]|nr:sensor histidine kinase [Marmoricola sp.]